MRTFHHYLTLQINRPQRNEHKQKTKQQATSELETGITNTIKENKEIKTSECESSTTNINPNIDTNNSHIDLIDSMSYKTNENSETQEIKSCQTHNKQEYNGVHPTETTKNELIDSSIEIATKLHNIDPNTDMTSPNTTIEQTEKTNKNKRTATSPLKKIGKQLKNLIKNQ